MAFADLFDDHAFSPLPEEELEEILAVVAAQQKRGSASYYLPLHSRWSRIARAHYRSQLPEWVGLAEDEGESTLVNECGTGICRGWSRVVIGDYGAFVEFTPRQALRGNFSVGQGGNKYRWLRTFDRALTKVYEQLGTVRYADYRPGCFYVDPIEVVPEPAYNEGPAELRGAGPPAR